MKRLDQIFELRYGHSLELNVLTQVEAPKGVNFVSRAMGNNGVTARVAVDAIPAQAGEISVALGGNGVLSSFVQPEPFVCGRDVMILRPQNPEMPLVERLWYCRCIWENRHRFSYGRQANRTLGTLKVPEPPTWAKAMKVPENSSLINPVGPTVELEHFSRWGKFSLESLFELKKGKRVTKAKLRPGNTRFIGASDRNNGITAMCDLEPMFPGGSITVPYDGSIGFAFVQNEPFFALDSVQVLIPKMPLNTWLLLYLATAIRHEKERFNYGYKWNLGRMKRSEIRLPTTPDGVPDWQGMEDFMKGLPFSSILTKSEV